MNSLKHYERYVPGIQQFENNEHAKAIVDLYNKFKHRNFEKNELSKVLTPHNLTTSEILKTEYIKKGNYLGGENFYNVPVWISDSIFADPFANLYFGLPKEKNLYITVRRKTLTLTHTLISVYALTSYDIDPNIDLVSFTRNIGIILKSAKHGPKYETSDTISIPTKKTTAETLNVFRRELGLALHNNEKSFTVKIL